MSTARTYLVLCAHRSISKSELTDMSIPEWGGFRTAEYQNEIYHKDWSKIDGYNKKSDHQKKDEEGKSIALDLCAFADGKQNWDQERLIYIHMLMDESWKELQEEGEIPMDRYLWWGGFWKNSWDKPHYYDRDYPQTF